MRRTSVHCCPRELHFLLNDAATPEIYTLSLHDALPILATARRFVEEADAGLTASEQEAQLGVVVKEPLLELDRKSTRLNSSHVAISYAVFCLKKKNTGVDARRYAVPRPVAPR